MSLLRPLLSLLLLLPVLPSISASIAPSIISPSDLRSELLAPILAHLGFHELSVAVPDIYSPVLSSWPGPVTIFAPSDESIRSCSTCSSPRLLGEHLVPGLFPHQYLSNLPSGTKLDTASPGRCLTITSINAELQSNNSSTGTKIFVDGVEITRPSLFDDGQIVIHGIQGFIAPLSPTSCDHEVNAIMRLMLHDAILRLRDGPYNILALAMRVRYAELVNLQNMTVFAIEDSMIFSAGHGYLPDVRFHVVPNRILMHYDLVNLRKGTVLPTLVYGQNLVVTNAASGIADDVRINYVPIKGFNEVQRQDRDPQHLRAVPPPVSR